MFSLHPQSGIPIYKQLVEQIRRMIAGGQLKMGDELPSVRELAIEHAVNPMTISKAYSILELEGLLVRQRGKPMQVAATTRAQNSEQARMEHLRPHLEQLVLVAKQLEISEEKIVEEFQRLFEGETK